MNKKKKVKKYDNSKNIGLINGYKPNRLSFYIILLRTGRYTELEKALYGDMEKYKEEK